MYEEATVLDYEGKKIWIKHIDKIFYCVNGRYVGFSDKQDLSHPAVVATALDEFYGPLHGRTADASSVITFSALQDGHLISSHCHLSDIKCDEVRVAIVRHEYEEWRGSVDISDVYIDRCLDMNLIEWLDRQDAKYERAGL